MNTMWVKSSSLLVALTAVPAFVLAAGKSTTTAPSGPFDFSAFPTTGNTAPVPINPAFSKLYDISRVTDNGRKSMTPSPYQPLCPTTDLKTCDFHCSDCFASSDVTTCGRANTWALTFNYGPSNGTASLLSFLNSRSIKATFFVLGMNVMQYPGVVQQAHKAGHMIGIEGWSGFDLTTLSADQILAELEYTRRIVAQVIGVQPAYYRPPSADVDNRVRFVASAMGLRGAVMYNYDTQDYNIGDPSATGYSLATQLATAYGKMSQFGLITSETDSVLANPVAIGALQTYITKAEISFNTIAQCIADPDPYGTGPGNVPKKDISQTQQQQQKNAAPRDAIHVMPVLMSVTGLWALYNAFSAFYF